jgi:hypothetical protein
MDLTGCICRLSAICIGRAYSGLQNDTSNAASFVGALLVIAHTLRAQTSCAPTRTGAHESENRYRPSLRSMSHLDGSLSIRRSRGSKGGGGPREKTRILVVED